MFVKEKNNHSMERTTPGSATMICAGTALKGDVNSEVDLRIDGTIQGNVYCSSKVIIGATGHVEGNIEGQQADVMGRVTGNIAVREILQLRGQCTVNGNIHAEKLQIEPSATFNGQCKMGTPVKTAQIKVNEVGAEA
jgi:cytoskeletal protein CcmA (bactofilin family)